MTSSDELEALVTQCAKTQSAQDHQKLQAQLQDSEVYLNLSTGPGGQRLISRASIGPLKRAILCFVSQTNPHLQAPFGGMQWSDALGMLARLPEADGIAVVNMVDDWVAFSREDALRSRDHKG